MKNHRIIEPEVLRQRADKLGSLNGLKLTFVELLPAEAELRLEFHNGNHLNDIVDAVQANAVKPHKVFAISGGNRIHAGEVEGQVRVTSVATVGGRSLLLRVKPIGDYSTYTLTAAFKDANGDLAIDPLLANLDFKFRPGCFNLNCAPAGMIHRPPNDHPAIDYLARDFNSFKHNLINAMRERVPGWAPTSEADLDQVLIDLLATDADEMADFQDRVMNEAYFGRARKRVSLARHARLLDYHIHQGNQASTWLVAEVQALTTLCEGTGVWTGSAWNDNSSVIFVTGQMTDCHPELNGLQLYTWSGAVTALEAGATEADLALPPLLNAEAKADADSLANILRKRYVEHLVLEQILNPETGTKKGVDKDARQLLRLLPESKVAEPVFDPVAKQWMIRVRWREADALKQRHCFVTDCTGQPPSEAVSVFRGNLISVSHGRPHRTRILKPSSELGVTKADQLRHEDKAHYEVTPQGALCTLPNAPLAYRDTAPGGEIVPRTSLQVEVLSDPKAQTGALWDEQSDLIESKGGDKHYLVETDELGVSRIRFGNGTNGRQLPDDAVVICTYQVGRGSDGNVGRDSLTGFEAKMHPNLKSVRNPFDVTNGRDPEPVEQIIRRVPEAYRSRQRRAVTLGDYERQAEALPGVSHARARYGWTGSWRAVRVVIDPTGSDELGDELRQQVQRNLDALRLIGEDLEVRAARYVGLDIELRLCADTQYWVNDLVDELAMRFSDGYLPGGAPAFFHPDRWTFSQPLHASQIIGVALEVQGVERVLSVSLRRLGAGGGADAVVIVKPEELPLAEVEKLSVDAFEVIRVANDPSHLERGRIRFDILGGRQ